MKIAYLSQTALSDVDFSYIKEAQKTMDITYYILVSPSQRQKAAINLKVVPDSFGIIPGCLIPELQKFSGIVNLEKVFVVNYTSRNNHQLSKVVEAYKVYCELKRCNYDVIHLTWPPSYLDLFIYRFKKKLVLTVHDPFPHSSQVFAVREFERKRAFRNCNNLVLLNSSQKDEFIRVYGLNKSSKHIYVSSLSCYNYLFVHKNEIKEPVLNQILFFGQIFAHKGVDYLLEAMIKVHEVCPDAKLIVAGGGEYWFNTSPYEELDYIDIRNRFIPDKELVSLVSSSAFVVVPYIDATQSGVIMTAYTFNRPCIATNVGGLPEMVKDGYNGLIVEPRNSSSLASAIIELLNNPQRIQQFSNQIMNDYKVGDKSWPAIAAQHKTIYERVCQNNN